MPYEAPGSRFSTVATKATVHGDPAVEHKHPGIAAKSSQAAPAVPSVANALAAQQIAIGEELVIMLLGLHEVDTDLLPGGAAAGDALYIAEADNSLLSAAEVAAILPTLVTGTVGANNAIRWTQQRGDDAVRITLVDPGAASQALSVDTDGDDIIVSLATSAGSALTSTATQVIAAIREHDVASQLVTVANSGASSGAGVVAAVPQTALAGGAAAEAGAIKFGRISSIDATLGRALVNLNLRDTF